MALLRWSRCQRPTNWGSSSGPAQTNFVKHSISLVSVISRQTFVERIETTSSVLVGNLVGKPSTRHAIEVECVAHHTKGLSDVNLCPYST